MEFNNRPLKTMKLPSKLSQLGLGNKKVKCQLCGKYFYTKELFKTKCDDCLVMTSVFDPNRNKDTYQFLRESDPLDENLIIVGVDQINERVD